MPVQKGKAGQAPKSASKKPARKPPAKKRATKPPARRGQQRPTPERYREIEEALAARGYFSNQPSGQWNAGAVEALRNFQANHNLAPTGRLDALSLILLGLGPAPQKR